MIFSGPRGLRPATVQSSLDYVESARQVTGSRYTQTAARVHYCHL